MKNHVFQKMLYVFLWWFLIVGVSIMCVYGCVSISSCVSKELLILEVLWWFSTAMCYSGSLPTPQKGVNGLINRYKVRPPQIDKLTYTLVH